MKHKTPLKSIRLRCLDCASSTYEVRKCEFKDCPLYLLRLGKDIPKGMSRVKSIRKYCVVWCMNRQPKEVILCPSSECSLYPFRLGKNPNRKRPDKTKIASKQPLESQKVVAERVFFEVGRRN